MFSEPADLKAQGRAYGGWPWWWRPNVATQGIGGNAGAPRVWKGEQVPTGLDRVSLSKRDPVLVFQTNEGHLPFLYLPWGA